MLDFLKGKDGKYHNLNEDELQELNRYRQTTVEWSKDKVRGLLGLDQYLQQRAVQNQQQPQTTAGTGESASPSPT